MSIVCPEPISQPLLFELLGNTRTTLIHMFAHCLVTCQYLNMAVRAEQRLAYLVNLVVLGMFGLGFSISLV
jgi:hypothetical protein